ncbi:YkgJ family cysteine cluster protein [Candidatus Thorarchaeota archaeon]|nr:MAG: YkgJ family cysteine cluster protein [Candidatus Thorarchaeota archaeon]
MILTPSTACSRSDESCLPRFECTRCGSCCRDRQILVTVTSNDIIRISKALELIPSEILRALDFYIVEPGTSPPVGLEKIPYITTERGQAYVALKKLENGDCIFLKDNECMIHPVRPRVCKSFPFVFNETDGKRSWGLSAKKEICPGLGKGVRISANELGSLAIEILQDFENYRKFADWWNSSSTSFTALAFIDEVFSIGRRISK